LGILLEVLRDLAMMRAKAKARLFANCVGRFGRRHEAGEGAAKKLPLRQTWWLLGVRLAAAVANWAAGGGMGRVGSGGATYFARNLPAKTGKSGGELGTGFTAFPRSPDRKTSDPLGATRCDNFASAGCQRW